MTPQPDDAAALRAYLLFVAERHLDHDLRAKAGPSDLVHDALLAAHAARHDYCGSTTEEHRSWLREILINLIKNFRRRYRDTLSRRVDREVPIDGHEPARDDTPGRAASAEEQSRRLADAVAALPEDHRRAVALRFDDGCSYAEIGRRLGRSEDAARMLLGRAVESLRAALPQPTN